eukprot:m.379791 g.379791  ORF g.379791 m.379791 type:complete len:344 (-) comp56220_c0_seq9:126-1157(-)
MGMPVLCHLALAFAWINLLGRIRFGSGPFFSECPVLLRLQWGSTPLHHAARQGHTQTVWMLLRLGADPFSTNADGKTPLDYAQKYQHQGVIEMLTNAPSAGQAYARPSFGSSRPESYLTDTSSFPLQMPRVATSCVEEFQEDEEWIGQEEDWDGSQNDAVSFRSDFFRGDSDSLGGQESWFGKEAGSLLLAAWEGRVDDCEELLRRGAETNCFNEAGQTPLHFAAWNGHLSVLQLLFKYGAGRDVLNKEGQAPLHVAAWQGQTDAVRLLLDAGADVSCCTKDGQSPLHLAAFQGHRASAHLLLNAGALPLATNSSGKTPLDLARDAHRADVETLLQTWTPTTS